jgi:large subunit ribosomal protein L17
MRHLRKGRKLNRTASHRKALLRKLASDLFQHKRIITTESKAKELRPYAEKIITRAKHALAREKNGLLPDGQTIDIHSRRVVAKDIRNKEVLQELFDTIAPLVDERDGGYCRIIKLDYRRGDNAPKALIELVDWSAPQEGATSLKPKKKSATKTQKPSQTASDDVKKEVEENEIVEDFEDNIKDTDEVKSESVEENVDNETVSEDINDEIIEDSEEKADDKKKDE